MYEFYLNVLRAHINPITSSIPPPDGSLTPLFTGLSTQDFPYEESTHQNQMTVVEVNEYSEIQLVQSLP